MSSDPNLSSVPGPTLWRGLLIAMWFGILAGLVEGAGLLLSQAVNWYQKPPHVSGEIIWISPVVDVGLFLLVVLVCLGGGRFVRRWPALRMCVFACILLTVYDWLMVFSHLYYLSCMVFAAGVSAVATRWLWKHENAIFRFWKRTLPWVVALFVVAAAVWHVERWEKERRVLAGLPPAAPGAPNVLVIVVDTLRADHLSSYGYARPTSPNLDRLASEGTVFENAVSPASWTFPSHVSLLTGRYLFQHGVGGIAPFPKLGMQDPSLGGWPTLGDVLERHGYRTGAFSANRSFFTGNLGFARGFARFEDFFYSPADMFVHTLYGREMASIYWRRSGTRTVARVSAWLGIKDTGSGYQRDWNNAMADLAMPKRASTINRELLQWIDQAPGDHPFFAFVNYFDVHMPYGGPADYEKPGWSQDTPTDHYDNGIKYVDDSLGELLTQLDARGLRQHTVIIVTSDHGESLGQHGLKQHGAALYWETVHVPLIISYPGAVPAGIRSAVPVSNASIPATVLDLAGVGQELAFPVPSVKPLWDNHASQSLWPPVWSELARELGGRTEDDALAPVIPTAETGAMESVVTPRWHFITHSRRKSQLYDWVHDPGETHDLIDTPEGQRVAADLRAQMQKAIAANTGLKP